MKEKIKVEAVSLQLNYDYLCELSLAMDEIVKGLNSPTPEGENILNEVDREPVEILRNILNDLVD